MKSSFELSGRGLSPRLLAIASMIPSGAYVADIGSGHGKLPCFLLAGSVASRCIAVERTAQSARELRALPPIAGLEIRIGDGLSGLDPRIPPDVLTISGLGARSTIRVLSRGRDRLRRIARLVVQPQTEAGLVRRWLLENGRRIADETLVRDRGRFYVIIAADRGTGGSMTHPHLEPDDLLEVGPALAVSGDPVVRDYWRRQLDRLRRILERSPDRIDASRARRHQLRAARVLDALDRFRPG